jgi:hypothetical protein
MAMATKVLGIQRSCLSLDSFDGSSGLVLTSTMALPTSLVAAGAWVTKRVKVSVPKSVTRARV